MSCIDTWCRFLFDGAQFGGVVEMGVPELGEFVLRLAQFEQHEDIYTGDDGKGNGKLREGQN